MTVPRLCIAFVAGFPMHHEFLSESYDRCFAFGGFGTCTFETWAEDSDMIKTPTLSATFRGNQQR